jgi:hypothetical protein
MCYKILCEKGVKMFHPSEQKISESGNEGGSPSMTLEDEIRSDADDEEGPEICRTGLGHLMQPTEPSRRHPAKSE